MSEESINHLVYSKNVIEFVTVANEYCTFIDNQANLSRFELIDGLHKIFPLLYLKACLLPEINSENLETPEKFLGEVDYNFLLNKISEKLAQFDAYHEVFDEGMQFSESAIETTISENVCDIYQDLKDFIMSFRIGNEEIMLDAIWECRNNFVTYWGQKLSNGLRALHAVRYGDDDINELEGNSLSPKGEESKSDTWVSKHFNNYFEGEEESENEL